MYKLSLLCFSIVAWSVISGKVICTKSLQEKLDNPAVAKFREYLQIDTSHAENLIQAVEFWKRQAEEVGLQFAVHEPAGKPICVLTWPGADPALPSIMLNSHVDVVPSYPDEWNHPPYAADVDEDGNIFARGAQDTKDIAIQCLEAIRRIKANNITLQRTIHITLMPDEETGGYNGMIPFLETAEFDALNVGFALDEGLTTETDDFYATYQDRRTWQMKFTVEGNGGHGFVMPENVAVVKLERLLNVMLEYRQPLADATRSKAPVQLGDYTSLNVNMINGGATPNSIPKTFSLVADMRLSPEENATEIMSLVNSWVNIAGNGTRVEFIRQLIESKATPVNESNPYWVAIQDTINQLGYNVYPVVCPATSDMVQVRNRGLPAIGFAPKRRTANRMHNTDEYLNVDVFLDGINVYVALIRRLGDLPAN